MPVSKKGNLYYTQEQYEFARYQTSALEYARTAGYELEKHGAWHCLKEHDSMVFAPNGQWFWNSRGVKGGAIEFMTIYEHKTLVEAVLELNGERGLEQGASPPDYRAPQTATEKKPFELPPQAANFKRLFAYLCGTRKLDPEIVQQLVDQKLLYESAKPIVRANGEKSEIHNAAFVSYNESGKAVAAFERGTSTLSARPYKGDVPGSDKENYGWLMPGDPGVITVCVFEAAIDAVSHATLLHRGGGVYRDTDRLALGGNMNHKPLLHYLAAHPQIKAIHLCFDNDKGGEQGTLHMRGVLKAAGYCKENGYQLYRQTPQNGKDFNEMLVNCQKAAEQAAQSPQPDPESAKEPEF